MPILNRWFIIPALGLSASERASIEQDVLGTFEPDTQRYSLDGSLYVIGYTAVNSTAQCLTPYTEYNYVQILAEMNKAAWSMPF
tara:strand:+ start:581 stop:832 length:252 start_codon:yes stop_codon:yes gene_type:complete